MNKPEATVARTIFGEELVDLSTARRKLIPRRPDGKPIAPSTLTRWYSKGISGFRLEVTYCGATPMTSVEAIQRFFRAVTAARLAKVRTDDAPQLLTATDADLAAAGLLS